MLAHCSRKSLDIDVQRLEKSVKPPSAALGGLGKHLASAVTALARLCGWLFPKCGGRDTRQVAEYAAKVCLVLKANLSSDGLNRVARAT